MYKSYSLSPQHYASKWDTPQDAELNDRKEVNELAVKYATLPDGFEKEEIFLQLVRSFHSYIMKYTLMVVKGQVPSLKTPAGKDAAKMLKTLMPAGKNETHNNLTTVCKTLHLAFKQQSTDDVYDIMVMAFLKATKKYDPEYHTKIKKVAEYLEIKLARKGIIDVSDVTLGVGFNSGGCLKWLTRKGFIEAVLDSKKKITGYKRGANWPIPAETFSTEPIGFTYFIPMWFRYYLNDYITQSMAQLESKPDIMQLEHAHSNNDDFSGNESTNKGMVPNLDGNFTDTNGDVWSADIELMNLQLDVSPINAEWVYSTDDKMFKDLTIKQRWILKMIYLDEFSWTEIAKNLDCTVNTAKAQWKNTLISIREKIDL